MGTAIDLDLWGHRVRIRAEVREAAETLRAALADHLRSGPLPLGFVVQRPSSRSSLHCLIDRSGLMLARARSWQDAVAVLAEQLMTFAPPPPGTIRTTMRAIIRESGSGPTAVLAGFPLLSLPPLVERQLERRSQRVVDRLAVDMTPNGEIALSQLRWPSLRPADPLAHCGSSATGVPIDAILVPAPETMSVNSHELIALVASTLRGVEADAALDVAEQFVTRTRIVPLNNVAARRHALEL